MEPVATRITTRLPFEKVRRLLRESCQAPYTMMLVATEAEGDDDALVLNLIFADGADLVRFRAALARGQQSLPARAGALLRSSRA